MFQFKLEPTHIKACSFTMSRDKSRPYLQGVHVYEKNGELHYESTNGHCVVRTKSMIEQEDDILGLDIIIPDFFVKQLSKRSFLKGFNAEDETSLDAVVDGQTISIEMLGGVTSNKLVEGIFPITDNVMPAKVKGTAENVHFAANLKYIAEIAKSISAFDGTTAADIAIGDSHSPFYFSVPHCENGYWEAAIMPIRGSGETEA